MTPLEENQEFTNTSGSINFKTGEETKPIVLEAISDKLPEFNEFFVLRLVNISGETYFTDLKDSLCRIWQHGCLIVTHRNKRVGKKTSLII